MQNFLIIIFLLATEYGKCTPPSSKPFTTTADFTQKVVFDYSKNADSSSPGFAQNEPKIQEGSHEDVKNLRWVVVTSEGDQHEVSLQELKEMLAEEEYSFEQDDDDSETEESDDDNSMAELQSELKSDLMEGDIRMQNGPAPELHKDGYEQESPSPEEAYQQKRPTPEFSASENTPPEFNSHNIYGYYQGSGSKKPPKQNTYFSNQQANMSEEILRTMEELLSESNEAPTQKSSNQRQRRRVFGRDDRYLSNPNYYPQRAVGRLDNGCTATFIYRTHAITAGHCAYNRINRRWYRNLNIRRQKNCDPNGGYYHRWKMAITVWGWYKYGYRQYDYALIVYRNRSPTWIWISYFTRYYWMGGHRMTISGYPVDKPKNCQYTAQCSIYRCTSTEMIHHCDTSRGMAGGPLFIRFWWYYRLYGVHTYGGYSYNYGVRISKNRYRLLYKWIRKYK